MVFKVHKNGWIEYWWGSSLLAVEQVAQAKPMPMTPFEAADIFVALDDGEELSLPHLAMMFAGEEAAFLAYEEVGFVV